MPNDVFPISRVLVAGTGVLGSQIAFQTAYHGFDVAVYDVDERALDKARRRFAALREAYVKDLDADDSSLDAALGRISCHVDLARAVENAQLVIEAIPENLETKGAFYRALDTVADKATIFASNSSTFVPSQLAGLSGRPDRYLHLHFANQIWKRNIAEVMGSPQTRPEVFDLLVAFAHRIGMVPMPIHKEKSGYILNSLLVPFLFSGLALVAEGVADVESVDKTWMISFDAASGPFGILDVIGIETAYNINRNDYERKPTPAKARILALLQGYLDSGKLGVATGEGFYKYPRPAYGHPDFLKPHST